MKTEEHLFDVVPKYKLYNETAVRVGVFFGGPIVAGYLIAENFKLLGLSEKQKSTWIYAIIATIVIIGGSFIVPGSERFPKFIIPLAYAWIASFLVQYYQGKNIKSHVESGGQLYSVGRAILIGLMGTIITVAIIFLIVLLTDKQLTLF